MATQIAKILTRRDSAADWTTNNPVLGSGEFAYETDTKRFKLGDGTTTYNSLSYFDSIESMNTFGIGAALTPAAGTITVDLDDLSEVKELQPSGNDTIDITNVSTTQSTIFRFRITNGGAHTLSWNVNSVAATSVTFLQSFTFTAAGKDECLAEIDENQNITIARWRENF